MARKNIVKVVLSDEELAQVKKRAGHEPLSSFFRRWILGSATEVIMVCDDPPLAKVEIGERPKSKFFRLPVLGEK